MIRKPWTTDPKQIQEALNALIDGRFLVTLQRQGGRPLQTRVLGIHTHGQVPYLLIARPAGLESAYQVQELLFKLQGTPILGFSCPITREGESVLATMLPYAMFCLDLRCHGPRLAPPPGSVATFFVKNRSKVNICELVDICQGGAKLTGQLPPEAIELDDLVGPCTMTLSGREAVFGREVTINASRVVRLELQNGGRQSFGISFQLSDSESVLLAEHLEYLAEQGLG